MKRSLKNATFVITGAAGGLGRALSFCLGSHGARIIGFDSNSATLRQLSVELATAGIDHQMSLLDLTNQKKVTQAVSLLADEKIDGLILNAGITRILRFTELSLEDFRLVFDVNFFASVQFTKLLLPQLIESKGSLVGISSVSGFAPLRLRTAYSSSKHALSAFLETLRSEEDDIDVLVVFPSYLQTAIRAGSEAKTQVGTISAEYAAKRIVNSIIKREKRLTFPLQAKLARLIWYTWPDLYIKLMKEKS